MAKDGFPKCSRSKAPKSKENKAHLILNKQFFYLSGKEITIQYYTYNIAEIKKMAQNIGNMLVTDGLNINLRKLLQPGITYIYTGCFLTGPPLKVSDYLVNPIKKVLSVKISSGSGT